MAKLNSEGTPKKGLQKKKGLKGKAVLAPKGKKEFKGPKANPSAGKPKQVGGKAKPVLKDETKPKKGPKPTAAATNTSVLNNKIPPPQKKLAGLVFMCNRHTKQDCFRNGVFGLPISQRNLVRQVTPGMKLFLFDIDARLLYGVFEAVSNGGVNIDPSAFDGKKPFPAQVRFAVSQECLPLSEAEFKPAISSNYIDDKKFSFDLGVSQVRRLIGLFRPAEKAAAPPQIPMHTGAPVPSGVLNQRHLAVSGYEHKNPSRALGYEHENPLQDHHLLARGGRPMGDPASFKGGYASLLDYAQPQPSLPPQRAREIPSADPYPRMDALAEADARGLQRMREVPSAADPFSLGGGDSYAALLSRSLARSSLAPPLPELSRPPLGLESEARERELLYRSRAPMYPQLQAGMLADVERRSYGFDPMLAPRPLMHVQDDPFRRDLEYMRRVGPRGMGRFPPPPYLR